MLTIDKLISLVSEKSEELQFQWLSPWVTSLKGNNSKKDSTITFIADNDYVDDLMRGGDGYMPVIIWLPRKEAKEIIENYED